jgi:hypothetical protein
MDSDVAAVERPTPAGGKSTVRRATRFLRALLADPVEVALYIPERWDKRHEVTIPHDTEAAWEAELHDWLGAPWPCPCTAEVDLLWQKILAEGAADGQSLGRSSYGEYSDGDQGLAHAVWYAVRHGRPDIVVETGVARGVTTRVVLEGLQQLGCGRLWSIDLPHPFERSLRDQTALLVPRDRRDRWRYIEGSSRRRLPRLLQELGHVDLFIHDSLHTRRNVRFEMEQAARALGPGGLIIVDDIDMQGAFDSFVRTNPAYQWMACRSADQQGSFGVVLKAR